ncbi:transcriptional regulatory protein QseB [mine drainage metagenome]|uniref:Transcriptional regulatory protein QseB n=1 Tax=mine drainage metagenome TaxID=410659 RepID=A0A1J5QIZ6_9ZZZZ
MRLLQVEDDAILGDALLNALSRAGYAVDWARSGSEADVALQDQIYDAVVLDLNLPGMDGFEVLQRLRGRRSDTPVLILTARDALDDRVRGLDLGADDYMLKPFDMPEFLARVRALLRRGGAASSNEIEWGRLCYDMTTRSVTADGQLLHLSARELGVLEALLMRVGKAVTKEALMEKLCNWDEDLGSNAIEVYVHRLRKKLEPYDVEIQTVRGLGYMIGRPA